MKRTLSIILLLLIINSSRGFAGEIIFSDPQKLTIELQKYEKIKKEYSICNIQVKKYEEYLKKTNAELMNIQEENNILKVKFSNLSSLSEEKTQTIDKLNGLITEQEKICKLNPDNQGFFAKIKNNLGYLATGLGVGFLTGIFLPFMY